MHDKIKPDPRRQLPAVNRVLEALDAVDLPRPVIVATVRSELAAMRETDRAVTFEEVFDQVMNALHRRERSRLQPVINGTGVILHTNFGRAPLSDAARESIAQVAAGYSNLEFDLETGQRGSRNAYLEHNLALLCRAEAATVVNNCAAALVLIARHYVAAKPEIIISRGELVQIGGGFRIGDILEASGATLREIGATNKTTVRDYERALGKKSAMILRVHRSNFFMEGFVDSVSTEDLARLARKRRVPLVVDLGSGLMEKSGIGEVSADEITPADALSAGVDLVCFSGDKLFGGPQAGIIAGRKRAIATLKAEPLFRALRCDKLTLAALQATADQHLREATAEIPALALVRMEKDELRARAAHLVTRLRGLPAHISIGRGVVKSGGGTSPRAVIPSVSLEILPENCSVAEFAIRLRAQTPPVVGYIAQKTFRLDLRTILSAQDEAVVDAIRAACTAH
jgi:L-seryl-tRNA(Ser) seleniumtransferase